jgi:hypothetical protein
VSQFRGLLEDCGIVIPLGVAAVRKQLLLIFEYAGNGLIVLSREYFVVLFEEL